MKRASTLPSLRKAGTVHPLTWLWLVMILLTGWSCNRDQPAEPKAETVQLDRNLYKSISGYRQAVESRTPSDGVKFTIENVRRDGNTLTVSVTGGCSEEAFQILWNGEILESYPAQVRLVLTHDAPDQVCTDARTFQLKIDLVKIIGPGANPADYVFHIANGSQIQDKSLDPNGAVSNG